MKEEPDIPCTFTDHYYLTQNFKLKNLKTPDGKPILNDEDVLNFYLGRRLECTIDQPILDQQTLDFISRYPVNSVEFANFFDSSGALDTRVFNDVLTCAEASKSPGSPLVYAYTTNKIAFDKARAEIYDVLNRRLQKYERLGRELWTMDYTIEPTPEDRARYLYSALMDPVLLGVKGEPRKNGKVPRLVAQVSVVENLLQRLLLQNHLLQEQQQDDLPTATSLDLVTEAKTKELYDVFKAQGILASNDVQGWEYSTNAKDQWKSFWKQAICMDLVSVAFQTQNKKRPPRLVIEISPGKEKHFFCLLAWKHLDIYRVVQLTSGKLVLTAPGITSSGKLTTFSENSFIRANLSNDVSILETGKPVVFVKTAGDDAVDTNLFGEEKAKSLYARFGKRITDYYQNDGPYSFCSTNFRETNVYGDNIERSAYALLAKGNPDEQDWCQFDVIYRHHPDFESIWQLLRKFYGIQA